MPTEVIHRVRWAVQQRVLDRELLWRHVANAGRSRAFQRRPPGHGVEAARVLADLQRDGCASTTLEELTGDPTLLFALQQQAGQWEQEQTDRATARRRRLEVLHDLGDGNDKLFLLQLLDADRPVVGPDDLLARISLTPALKGIADSYYGMRTQVADLNVWRTLPTGHVAVASQLWHRDQPDDHFILKLFVYLEDVGPGSGPFSYLVGTHGKGDRRWRPPGVRHDGYNHRAGDLDMDQSETADRRRVFTGPAGTVVLADTIGWHKGGQATEHPRLLFHALYSSPAARPVRRLGRPLVMAASDRRSDLAYETPREARRRAARRPVDDASPEVRASTQHLHQNDSGAALLE